MRGSGVLRSLGVLAAGAGLVAWSPHVPTVAVPVGAPRAASAGSTATGAGPTASGAAATGDAAQEVPVRAARLVCLGLGSSATPSAVAFATAPAAALQAARGGAGSVVLRPLAAGGSGRPLARVGSRGRSSGGPAAAASVVTATGALAPGVVAGERLRLGGAHGGGRDRALLAAPCAAPAASAWLVGGGAQAGRRESILLANPGATPAAVDLRVLGSSGPVDSANGHGIVVPPGARRVVALDAIAGSERSPVVEVRSQGSAVAAVLVDRWVEGLVPRGADAATPAEAPVREQVVAGVAADGPASVRVAVPGTSPASVQVRLLTTTGPRALPSGGQLQLVPGSSHDLDLSGLPAGSYAVQVRSSQPVIAGAVVQRRGAATQPSDLAWSPATTPITHLAGAALRARGVAGPSASVVLSLAATGSSAQVRVTTVSATGSVRSAQVRVAADSVAARPLGGAASVWVTPVRGQVRAAVVESASDRKGRLVSIGGLSDLTLTAPGTTLREVAG